jgi:hypothetical protein
MGTGGKVHGSFGSEHAFVKRAPVLESGTIKKMIPRGSHELLDVPTHKMGARLYDANRTQISHHDLVHTCNRYQILNIGR